MTSLSGSLLPEFNRPPLSEVALSVQFEALDAMRTVHTGLLWNKFRESFPGIEEQPPLASAFERFGVRKSGPVDVTIELPTVPPLNRVWFLSADRTQLIQVQRDRIVHNWRKVGDADTYPRYEKIRDVFRRELVVLKDFAAEEQLGELLANQCELTYVDHVVAGEGWTSHSEIDKIVTMFRRNYSDPFLSEPEEVEATIRFVMKDEHGGPIGRLHVAIQPGYRRSDGVPIYLMRFTARGRPAGSTMASAIDFLDGAREWIVRGFTSITMPEMHAVWLRQDRST